VIVDNPKVGADLASVYWQPGNSKAFLDLVRELTGKELTGTAWVRYMCVSIGAYLSCSGI
jgi:hypothetical protein